MCRQIWQPPFCPRNGQRKVFTRLSIEQRHKPLYVCNGQQYIWVVLCVVLWQDNLNDGSVIVTWRLMLSKQMLVPPLCNNLAMSAVA